MAFVQHTIWCQQGVLETRISSRPSLRTCPCGISDRPAKHGRQPISMAGKTSKASTQPPGEALSPKHEAFVQAYVSRGMNGTKAYRAAYPGCKSDEVARAAAARLLANVSIRSCSTRSSRTRTTPTSRRAPGTSESRPGHRQRDAAPGARLAVASSERRARRSP
jgi:Terminase small subunit